MLVACEDVDASSTVGRYPKPPVRARHGSAAKGSTTVSLEEVSAELKAEAIKAGYRRKCL